MREIIKNSLTESFKVIRNSKYLFIILFITQALFLFAVSSIFAYYAVQIGEHAQAIITPLQESVQDQEAMEAGIYTLPAQAYRDYQEMIKNVAMFFLFAYLAYILINGVNWDLTNFMLTEKDRWLHYTSMFGLITIAFTLPAMLIINVISQFFIVYETAGTVIVLGLVILPICLYFMYIAFSSINHYRHKEIPAVFRHSYSLGMKNFRILLPTYLICALPFILLAVLGFFFPEQLIQIVSEMNFYLLISILIFFVLYINWSRIYFLVTMEKLRKF